MAFPWLALMSAASSQGGGQGGGGGMDQYVNMANAPSSTAIGLPAGLILAAINQAEQEKEFNSKAMERELKQRGGYLIGNQPSSVESAPKFWNNVLQSVPVAMEMSQNMLAAKGPGVNWAGLAKPKQQVEMQGPYAPTFYTPYQQPKG